MGNPPSFRQLSWAMFEDGALLKSLNQLEWTACFDETTKLPVKPVENFAREWLERFSVGVGAHNEGDVRRLARGLMNCPPEVVEVEGDVDTEKVKPVLIFKQDYRSAPLSTRTRGDRRALVNA